MKKLPKLIKLALGLALSSCGTTPPDPATCSSRYADTEKKLSVDETTVAQAESNIGPPFGPKTNPDGTFQEIFWITEDGTDSGKVCGYLHLIFKDNLFKSYEEQRF